MNGSEKLAKNVADQVICRKCKHFYHPPIFCCVNGHTLCPRCVPQMIQCNECKGRVTSKRNFLLEELYESCVVVCKNAELGCTFRDYGAVMLVHHEMCDFGWKRCPVAGCGWRGELTWLTKHFLQNHKN